MKRYLTWHRERPYANGEAEGPIYLADVAYGPGHIRLHARKAPDAGDLQIDIRSDGVSLLTGYYARMTVGETVEEEGEDYPQTTANIAEGAVVTFHIISSGGAEDITCTLEVESVDEDEE
jgi:hypothetical protein